MTLNYHKACMPELLYYFTKNVYCLYDWMYIVCNITCPNGYSAINGETCSCQLTDICEAEQPCQNGGTCILTDSFPNRTSYECNCGNLYTDANCTGK